MEYDMLHQGKVKRGQGQRVFFAVVLGLLTIILLFAHQLYGFSMTEELVQILSVLVFYSVIAIGLYLSKGEKRKRNVLD